MEAGGTVGMKKSIFEKQVRDKSKETGLHIQEVQNLFAMERLLYSLSQTNYKEHFILKGGFLLTTKHGLQLRSTVDIDFTFKNAPLTVKSMKDMIVKANQYLDENEKITLNRLEETREHFEYSGYSARLTYHLDRSHYDFKIDVTTGEDLIDMNYSETIKGLFGNDLIEIYSYSSEQIIADKFYTMIAYGNYDDTNSRMKDYYDMYMLNRMYSNLNYTDIVQAINKTMQQRNEMIHYKQYDQIIDYLSQSENQHRHWERYQDKTPYASDISFVEVMAEIKSVNQKIVEVEENRNN